MNRSLALTFVALIAAGCATRASYHRLAADVSTLRGEVNDLRQAQEGASRDAARAAGEVRTLEGRVQELAAAQATSGNEVTTLRERVAVAESQLRDTRAQVAAMPPPSPPAAPVQRERPAPAMSAPQAYQAAMATFRAREYGQAVLDLVDFMANYPKDPLVGNAQYWIGEAYYVQRDYRQAMTEFQKVLDVAPGSPKVPDALLKIGLCYRSLRDESHARQMWARVAADYPGSQAAGKARALMRTKASTAR